MTKGNTEQPQPGYLVSEHTLNMHNIVTHLKQHMTSTMTRNALEIPVKIVDVMSETRVTILRYKTPSQLSQLKKKIYIYIYIYIKTSFHAHKY